MAMDESDKRLVNGAILAAVFFGVVYFWPGWFGVDGISGAYDKLTERRESLKKTSANYSQHFSPMQPAHFGETGEPNKSDSDVAPIADLFRLYNQANDVTNQFIRVKKKANRMVFPYWTDIPLEERIPGSYFRLVWDDKKFKVAQRCLNANVELDAPNIGFDRLKSIIPDEAKAKEYLRELHIAEKIIDLCIQAKLNEEKRERDLGNKPEAYMKILEIDPKDSEPTGPTALVPNPRFDPSEKNPSSPKFRKYNVDTWPNFIQEYPVKIQLICDTNTFIQFMYSVRTAKDANARFEFRGTETRDGQTIAHLRVIDDEFNAELQKKETDGRLSGWQHPRFIEGELNFEVQAGDTLPDCKCTVTKVDAHGVSMLDEMHKPFEITEGQFLVMRQLEILSPALDDTKFDKSEQTPFKTDGAATDVNGKKRWPDRKEQIVVTIIAAGMDFFDPLKFPGGLYVKQVINTGPKPRPGRRTLAPSAKTPGQ